MATASLGRLTLDLVARIGGYTAPLDQAQRKTVETSNLVGKKFGEMRDSINANAGAIGVAVLGVTTAMFALADAQAKYSVEVQQNAYIAGAQVAEFQKMAAGARAYGVEQQQLADMLKDFREKANELTVAGSGGMVDFFEQVALKTEGSAEAAMKLQERIATLSGPEGMALYVAKMEEAGLSQGQMSFLMESMASDSTKLIPLMQNNAEAMRLWGDEAERVGLVIDENTLKASIALQTQMLGLEMRLEGVKNQVASAVIPAMIDVSEAFLGGGESALKMASGGEILAGTLRGVAQVAIGVVATVNLVGNSIAGVTKSAVDAYNIMEGLRKKQSDKGWSITNLPAQIIAGGSAFFGKGSGVSMAANDNSKVIAETTKRLNDLKDGQANESTKMLAQLAAQKKAFEEQQAKSMQGAQDLLAKTAGGGSAASKALKQAAQSQAIFNQKLEEANRLRDQVKYEYSSELGKKEIDYQREIADIKTAYAGEKYKQEQADYLAKAKAKYEQDVALFKQAQQDKLNSITSAALADSQAAQDKIALMQFEQQNGKGAGLDLFSLQIGQMRDQANLDTKFNDRVKNANEATFQDDPIKNAEARKAALLQIEEAYKNESVALAMQGAVEQGQIAKDQHQQQLALWGSMLSQASVVWGDMTQMVRDAAGENSTAFKAMFLFQQALAVGQAIIATELAAVEALKLGPILGIPASALVRGMGYASVGLIASQTISGMAHNGIDNIPKEGTWLLDGGERVLNPQQNKDLTNYLKNGGGGGRGTVTINNYGKEEVSASEDEQGNLLVTIGKMVDGAVDRGIARNMRQGYPLGTALKGR